VILLSPKDGFDDFSQVNSLFRMFAKPTACLSAKHSDLD